MGIGMVLKTQEADPDGRRGEPRTWSAIGLKQFSYQPEGDELRMLPAGKSTGRHLRVRQKWQYVAHVGQTGWEAPLWLGS